MPKQTFNNISSIKQKMILDVAVKEFTTKSFEEVSVNSIVKAANISRGSFYTYFEDLEDLFEYLVQNVKTERLIHAVKLIDDSEDSFFNFIKLLFEYDLQSFSSDSKYSLLRNYMHYIRFNKKSSLSMSILNPLYQNEDLSNEYVNQVVKLQIPGMSKTEFFELIEVVFIIMIDTYFKLETESISKEDLLARFKRRMNMLEFGVNNNRNEGKI